MKTLSFLAVTLLMSGLVLEMTSARPAFCADSGDDQDQQNQQQSYQKSKLTNDEQETKADKRKLLLTTGEDKPVDLDFDVAASNALSIGNPKIVATTLVKIGDKRQVVFKPLSKGETNVTVRDQNGDIKLIFLVRVTDSSLLRIAGELRDLLRDVEGIDVRVVGSKVVIDGELITPSDYGRLATVVGDKAYSDYVINLAQLSNKAMTVISKRIQQDINSFAPNVTTRVVNGVVFLEGTVDNIDQDRRAQSVATVYLPDVRPNTLIENQRDVKTLAKKLVQDFVVVNPPPPKKQEKMIRVTFNFVELSKDYDKVFGFKWQPGFSADPQITVAPGGSNGASAAGSSFTATLSNLFPHLQMAQEAGYARTLRTGTVIVRSGQPASLEEATQFPFSAAGQNGSVNAGSTDVGMQIGVTPSILGQSEDIALDVKLSQSNVVGRDPSGGTRPVTSKHHVETRIYVKSTESAAIAGVNAQDIGTDFNKDDPQPGSFTTGTDPLFTMLHSKEYRKKKSQYVIFVTPQIVDGASEGTEDLKKNFRVRVR
jgi:pilus assembly protein CpaC